jgi:DNA replication protein DnaC
MRELIAELKELRLHGMAAAWVELAEQRADAALEGARWLIEHLLQAEATDRATRSVRHQMHAAKFPVHRDLAGFDFDISPVDRKLVLQLADMSFTEQARNLVLLGGPEYAT